MRTSACPACTSARPSTPASHRSRCPACSRRVRRRRCACWTAPAVRRTGSAGSCVPTGLLGIKLANPAGGVRVRMRLLADDLSTQMWDRHMYRLQGEPMPEDDEYVPTDVSTRHRLIEVTAQGQDQGAGRPRPARQRRRHRAPARHLRDRCRRDRRVRARDDRTGEPRAGARLGPRQGARALADGYLRREDLDRPPRRAGAGQGLHWSTRGRADSHRRSQPGLLRTQPGRGRRRHGGAARSPGRRGWPPAGPPREGEAPGPVRP